MEHLVTEVMLSDLRSRQVGIIQTLELDYSLLLKLAEMGIFRGSEIRVLRCIKNGPVLLENAGSRTILGHGVAKRIKLSISMEAEDVNRR